MNIDERFYDFFIATFMGEISNIPVGTYEFMVCWIIGQGG